MSSRRFDSEKLMKKKSNVVEFLKSKGKFGLNQEHFEEDFYDDDENNSP